MFWDIFTFYIIGCVAALIIYMYGYYWYNAINGKDIRYIFSNPRDIWKMFIFSLGSWVAVYKLAQSED